MKNNLLKFSFVISIAIFFTSCIATHVGNMSGSASLNSPNFVYKSQNVGGSATASYFIGIGGMARQSLVAEAKKDMLRKNPLLNNQALANVTVSYKTTGFLWFIVTVVECNVSADIVEFGPMQTNIAQSQPQNSTVALPVGNSISTEIKTENKKVEIDTGTTIKIGDKVNIIKYFSTPVEGIVIDIRNREYLVEYKKSNNKTKQVKVLDFQVEKIQ